MKIPFEMVPFFGDMLVLRGAQYFLRIQFMTIWWRTWSYCHIACNCVWHNIFGTICSTCIALNLVYIYNSKKHRKEIRTSKIKSVKYSQCPLPKSLNHGKCSSIHGQSVTGSHEIAQRCQLPPPCVVRAPPRTLGDAHLGRNQAPGNHRSYRNHLCHRSYRKPCSQPGFLQYFSANLIQTITVAN